MSKRIVFGPRANGDVGLFVSPAGIDADTAADNLLLLNVTSKVSQLLLLGRAGAGSTVVSLGLARSPLVFVTSQWDWSGVAGHTLGPGPFRPSPPVGGGANASFITINGNGASMNVAGALATVYEVYGQAFT